MGSAIFFVFPKVCSNCLSDLAKIAHGSRPRPGVVSYSVWFEMCLYCKIDELMFADNEN